MGECDVIAEKKCYRQIQITSISKGGKALQRDIVKMQFPLFEEKESSSWIDQGSWYTTVPINQVWQNMNLISMSIRTDIHTYFILFYHQEVVRDWKGQRQSDTAILHAKSLSLIAHR